MKKAIVVDKNYGSVTIEDLVILQKRFAEAGIELELAHFNSEEEIIAGCQDADAILGTGNPPITEKVLKQLPNLKIIQRFGIGVNSINLPAATETDTVVLAIGHSSRDTFEKLYSLNEKFILDSYYFMTDIGDSYKDDEYNPEYCYHL